MPSRPAALPHDPGRRRHVRLAHCSACKGGRRSERAITPRRGIYPRRSSEGGLKRRSMGNAVLFLMQFFPNRPLEFEHLFTAVGVRGRTPRAPSDGVRHGPLIFAAERSAWTPEMGPSLLFGVAGIPPLAPGTDCLKAYGYSRTEARGHHGHCVPSFSTEVFSETELSNQLVISN